MTSTSYKTSKYGVYSFIDTGAPKSSPADVTKYTTIVILHGYVFHGGEIVQSYFFYKLSDVVTL